MNMFNKWTTFKSDFHKVATNKRPLVAAECDNLGDAEKWRRELVRDITKKIALIQNANLGEYRVRELNDEINKAMRQKHFWETRIIELGGGDHKGKKQFFDVEGKELPGAPGYKYYGVAKELPGVRELFAEEREEIEKRRRKRTRADIAKNITPDYYGYRDDDDGILQEKEAIQEAKLISAAVKESDMKKRKIVEEVRRSGGVFGKDKLEVLEKLESHEDDEDEEAIAEFLKDNSIAAGAGDPAKIDKTTGKSASKESSAASDANIKAHVPVPTQDEMAALLLEEKKKSLLGQFLGAL